MGFWDKLFRSNSNKVVDESLKQLEPLKIYQMSKNNHDYVMFGSYPQQVVLNKSFAEAILTKGNKIDDMTYEYNGNRYAINMLHGYHPNGMKIADNFYPERPETGGWKIILNKFLFSYSPILWRVFDLGDKYLFVSTEILDYCEYSTTDYVSYDQSKLRDFLNKDFINKAFTDEEQQYIKITRVKNDKLNCGGYADDFKYCSDTSDKIFVLSFAELFGRENDYESRPNFEGKLLSNEYLFGGKSGCYKTMATDYALMNSSHETEERYCTYWLRGPGSTAFGFEVANAINYKGENVGERISDIRGVKPCFCIDKKLVTFEYDYDKALDFLAGSMYLNSSPKNPTKTVPTINHIVGNEW